MTSVSRGLCGKEEWSPFLAIEKGCRCSLGSNAEGAKCEQGVISLEDIAVLVFVLEWENLNVVDDATLSKSIT